MVRKKNRCNSDNRLLVSDIFLIDPFFHKYNRKMKNSSFESYRSINNKLHNKITQEDEYARYLKRIDNIVDRPVVKDKSSDHYMQLLNKMKSVARDHRNSEEETRIVVENKHLLDKILKNRTRKFQVPNSTFHLAMHQKRNREMERINQENKKIAQRINHQYSALRKTLTSSRVNDGNGKSGQKKRTQSKWNFSPLKAKKLPKLVGQDRDLNTSSQYKDSSQSQTKMSRFR